jgi:hypothetical protein
MIRAVQCGSKKTALDAPFFCALAIQAMPLNRALRSRSIRVI